MMSEGPNLWLIAVSVMLATFMEVNDASIASVALPFRDPRWGAKAPAMAH
jgi:hypothetical protein